LVDSKERSKMSYLVMALKYRPQVFEEIVGQDHITITLINAIKSKRIAHSYLFAGPRGTGKTTTARILAKSLNCAKGITPIPCNICDSCKEINLGRSIDVFEMDAASKSKVDDIRELIIEGVKYSPVRGKYKIYIIDEVQMLSPSAFDALLKTIEEPPKNVVFVFATTEPHEIPPTILSRCQRFDFRRVPFSDLVMTIEKIAEKEKIKIKEDAVFILARKADGSVRDALSLLDQVIAYGGKEIEKEVVEKILGIVDQQTLFELTDIIAKKDAQKGLALLSQLIDSGVDIQDFAKGFLDHLRNLLIAKVQKGSLETQAEQRLFDLSKEYIEKYKKESEKFSDTDILRMINIVADSAYILKRTSEPRVHLEIALMKMIKMEKNVLLEDVIHKLDYLFSGGLKKESENKSKDRHIEKLEKDDFSSKKADLSNLTEELSQKSSSSLNWDDIKSGWDRVLEWVKKSKVSLWPCLVEGKLASFEDGFINLLFYNGRQFHKQQLEKKDNFKLVQKALEQVYGSPVPIKFTLDTTKNAPSKNPRIKSNFDKEKIIQKDPLIKSLLENFEGEITEE